MIIKIHIILILILYMVVFNLLRMRNHIYAFLLKKYETICIDEYYMIITSEINSIFDF